MSDGLNAAEAAVMFTEGVRAGVNACLKDLQGAAERLSKSGQTMPAATVASLIILLQRHVPKPTGVTP